MLSDNSMFISSFINIPVTGLKLQSGQDFQTENYKRAQFCKTKSGYGS